MAIKSFHSIKVNLRIEKQRRLDQYSGPTNHKTISIELSNGMNSQMVDGVIANHLLSEEASRMTRKLPEDLLATVRNSNNTTFQRRRSCGVKHARLTRKYLRFSRTISKEQLKSSHSQKDSLLLKLVI